jgi:hypothetical protein
MMFIFHKTQLAPTNYFGFRGKVLFYTPALILSMNKMGAWLDIPSQVKMLMIENFT